MGDTFLGTLQKAVTPMEEITGTAVPNLALSFVVHCHLRGWTRRLAHRLFGLPVTRFEGANFFHCWKLLTLSEKARSVFGTIRRILSRRLFLRLRLNKNDAVEVKQPHDCGAEYPDVNSPQHTVKVAAR